MAATEVGHSPGFWRELLTSANTGDSNAMEQARLRGLQLMAAEQQGVAGSVAALSWFALRVARIPGVPLAKGLPIEGVGQCATSIQGCVMGRMSNVQGRLVGAAGLSHAVACRDSAGAYRLQAGTGRHAA